MIQKINGNIEEKNQSSKQENQSGEFLLREKIKKFLSSTASDEIFPEPQKGERSTENAITTQSSASLPVKNEVNEEKINTFIDTEMFDEENAGISALETGDFLNTADTEAPDEIIDAQTQTDEATVSDFAFNPAEEYIKFRNKARDPFLQTITSEEKPETEIISLLKQELQWYYSRRDEEKNRLKEIHGERLSAEEKFRKEEEELKDEINELNRRKQEEKLKLQKIHENRLIAEEKYNQQERELRKNVEFMEERKLDSIRQIDQLEQKKNEEEQTLKQLNNITRAEMELIEKKIDQEKQNLHTFKQQAMNAQEKLKEFDILLNKKKEELAEQQHLNNKIISRLNEEIKKTEHETDSIREKISSEINDIIERRAQIQDQFDKQAKDFDIFKKTKLGEKERLEEELSRIQKYSHDERETLYSLKEQKIKLEKQIQQQKALHEQEIAAITREKEELEFQINHIKQSFAQEYTDFKEKKQELKSQEENLQRSIEEKEEEKKTVLREIERLRKECSLEKEKTSLEIEEINQDLKLANLKLDEIRKNIEAETKNFNESQSRHNDKLVSIRREIENQEHDLLNKRAEFVEEQRRMEQELAKTKKEHKELIELQNDELQQLEADKNRLHGSTNELISKKDVYEGELTRLGFEKDALGAQIEEHKIKLEKERLNALDEQATIKRETDRLKSLRLQEEEELQSISYRRQKSEDEYHASIRLLEAQIDKLTAKKIELELEAD